MRLIVPIIVFLITGVLAHVVVLGGIPGFIMGKAHQTFEAQGIPLYQFVASPRQTPQTQRIVRPSPDLAYAICRFDTTQGPVFINAPKGQGYGSLSIFNSQHFSQNFTKSGSDSLPHSELLNRLTIEFSIYLPITSSEIVIFRIEV
mgnify:CR=1 FL=1